MPCFVDAYRQPEERSVCESGHRGFIRDCCSWVFPKCMSHPLNYYSNLVIATCQYMLSNCNISSLKAIEDGDMSGPWGKLVSYLMNATVAGLFDLVVFLHFLLVTVVLQRAGTKSMNWMYFKDSQATFKVHKVGSKGSRLHQAFFIDFFEKGAIILSNSVRFGSFPAPTTSPVFHL